MDGRSRSRLDVVLKEERIAREIDRAREVLKEVGRGREREKKEEEEE